MKFKVAIHLFFMAVAFVLSPSILADESQYEELFEQANKAYKAGNYDTAQTIYTSIAQNGMVSSELYYNLGNTYYKLNSLPAAILYYERALRLNPKHKDAKYNLNIANAFISDKIEPIEQVFFAAWWQSAAMGFSLSFWVLMWFIGLIGLALLLTLFFVAENIKIKQLGLLGGMVTVIAVSFIFLLANTNYNQQQRKDAIVFASTLTVKSEPRLNGTDQFVIHAGLKVLILDKEDDWSRIELSDGNSGWIPNESIEAI